MKIPVFGNGDINTPEKALAYKDRYGVDGVMIGRAAIGNPWIFSAIKHFIATGKHPAPPTITQRVQTITEHLNFSITWKGERLGILEMRKHYANYLRGLPAIKPLRMKLVNTTSIASIRLLLSEIVERYTPVSQPSCASW